MQSFSAGQANTVFLDVVTKTTGSPITSGTVNFYLIDKDGDNAGKWFRASDSTWQAAESSAGEAAFKGGAAWELEIESAAWASGVNYELYAKESGDLNVIYTDLLIPVSIAFLYESGAGGTCPVDLTEMKLHLRVDSSDDDTLITQLMLAATNWAEMYQVRTYITRTRYMYLDSFPLIIQPPYSPLSSVTSIQYYDIAGDLQTLSSSYYRVDTVSQPGRITEAYGYSWPSTRDMTNAVIVTYESGYGEASDVPEEIKAAIKMIVGHLYQNREAVSELSFSQVPLGVKALLGMQKIITI